MYGIMSMLMWLDAMMLTPVVNKLPAPIRREFEARITFYHKFQDSYGKRVAMNTKLRAEEGTTVAAHPVFPFGTKLRIPELEGLVAGDGKFVVQDRGSAVTKKKASKGEHYVFDVYIEVNSPKEAKQRLKTLMRDQHDYMKVYVLQ